MRRRALLASLATTLTATAGCLSDGQSAGGGSQTDDLTTDAQSGTDTRTTTDAGTDATTGAGTPEDTETPDDPVTETPTPPPASDAFADFDCPSFDETARTVCYHDAALDDAPLVLTAEPEVFDPETGDDTGETLEFVLYNRSEWSVGFNPYDWGIERYDDGEWVHIAPEMTPLPWMILDSGATFTWSLSTGAHPSPDDERTQPVDVALEPGIYAFHVSVSYGGVDGTETATETEERPPEGRTELIALFEVETAMADGETATDDGTASTDTASGS